MIKQESSLCGVGGSESEHTAFDGQSPQEHPSKESPHEYIGTSISLMSDESGTLDLKLIAYGDPGTLGGTLLPMNASHSNMGTKRNIRAQQKLHGYQPAQGHKQAKGWHLAKLGDNIGHRIAHSSNEFV